MIPQPHNYDPALKCCWVSWHVRGPGRLDLTIARTNSTDMAGAIAIGTRLMPTVQEIYVFNDWGLDIVYALSGGRWTATDQRMKRRALIAEQERVTERDDYGRP